MAEQYKIVFEGQLRPGVELETARLNLAQLFKSDVSGVDRLFTGRPVTIKRGLTQDDAQRYLKALNDAGVEGRIEPEEPLILSLEEVDSPSQQAKDAQIDASPYAPPRSSAARDWPEVGELKVFSVQGRIGCLRFMAWTLVLAVAATLVGGACFAILSMSLIAGGLLGTIVLVAIIVVAIQIGAQRLHDAGWSAWLLLLYLVPVLGGFFPILMMAIPGNSGPNQYGPPPPPNSKSVRILATLWLLVLAGFFIAGVTDGLQTIQDEVEATTGEYEQSLPYDDDADEAAPPEVPVDPADSGDSSDSADDQ